MLFIASLLLSPISMGTRATDGLDFIFQGTFLEGCSCASSCAFESTGAMTGCRALGVYSATSGSFDGQNLAGLKFAFVAAPQDALYIYLDARNDGQRKAAEKLARFLFAEGFGKIKAVKDASISLKGRDGTYLFKINDGKTVDMTTQAIIGGDGKSLVELRNVFGDPYDTLFQGKTLKAIFNDGSDSFGLSGTNSYFVETLKIHKRL